MRFYANENFPEPAVSALRALGHDVLTTRDAGNANRAIADPDVLTYATTNKRILVTLNRRNFIRLHEQSQEHGGIVVCHEDLDFARLARRVHEATSAVQVLERQLVSVRRP